jgi:hypothetical protein
MTITIATAQIARVDIYHEAFIDITIKSAGPIGRVLTPTWGLVAGYKHHQQLEAGQEVDERWRKYWPLTWEEYAESYLNVLRLRYRTGQIEFVRLLEHGEREGKLVLCCYCRPGDHCHRHLAAPVMAQIARRRGLQVSLLGEMP